VLYEKAVIGGLAAVTTGLKLPGFPDGIDGLELARTCRKQAERLVPKLNWPK